MDGLEAKAREYQVEETLEALEAARVSTAAVPLLHPLLSRSCPLPAFLHAMPAACMRLDGIRAREWTVRVHTNAPMDAGGGGGDASVGAEAKATGSVEVPPARYQGAPEHH